MCACQICSKKLKYSLINMGKVPIANHLILKQGTKKKTFNLEVFLCKECNLYQLGERLSPKVIFDNYFYHSSYSSSFLEHSKKFVQAIQKKLDFSKNNFVLEIASNDGYLLKNFNKNKFKVLGIEPSQNVAKLAKKIGINTEAKFFNISTSKFIKKKYGVPRLIIANNVLAHVPNLKLFFKSLEIVSSDETIITIEFPSVKNMIKLNQFDTIYHEHYTYLSLSTIEKLLKKSTLKVFNLEKIKTHGGSLRLWLSKNPKIIKDSVIKERKSEKDEKIFQISLLKQFSINAETKKKKFLVFLKKAKKDNKSVCAYGAAAKGISFLNFCGKDSKYISCIYDKNIMKQGCFIPGLDIKILDPNKIKDDKPDYIIILPWNIKKEIKNELKFINSWGGKFITFE